MEENMEQLLDFIEKDNGRFLEELIDNLTDKELTNFLNDNPDFIKEI